MDERKLIIIGSSHIAKESLKEVERILHTEKPDIVALELDKARLRSLLDPQERKIQFSAIRHVGFKGFLFSVFGAWAEKKLGKVVGVSPGSEMLKAVEIAKKEKMKIALIDQPIEITLRKFSKALTWKEKWNFVKDFFKVLVGKKQPITFDLSTVPDSEIIEKMLEEVKISYPNIYKVLIEDRNEVMAYHLKRLQRLHPDEKIVAIVGAGHKKGIEALMREGKITYSFHVGKNKV